MTASEATLALRPEKNVCFSLVPRSLAQPWSPSLKMVEKMEFEGKHNSEDTNETAARVAKDPICRMKVNKKTALKLAHQERTYYF